MAVVSSFTYLPEALIPPSQEVTFTDTSTGSPDRWYWDFGDGEYSEEQHPTHTFEGASPETFTVTLQAWIAGTETVINKSNKKEFINQPGGPWGSTNAEAYATWLSWGYGSNTPECGSFMVQQNDPDPDDASYKYLGGIYGWDQSVSALGSNGVMIVLRVTPLDYHSVLNRSIGTPAGNLSVTVDGDIIHTIPSGGFGVEYTAGDITSIVAGQGTQVIRVSPIDALLPATWNESQGSPPFNQTGIIATIEITLLETTAPENLDESEQELIFGTPPIAIFDASPKSVPGGSQVQFENLSTLAVGLPTTWSWKKKLSGSEDPFVEFSTEENPLETFTK